jgi:hypothetical protein
MLRFGPQIFRMRSSARLRHAWRADQPSSAVLSEEWLMVADRRRGGLTHQAAVLDEDGRLVECHSLTAARVDVRDGIGLEEPVARHDTRVHAKRVREIVTLIEALSPRPQLIGS